MLVFFIFFSTFILLQLPPPYRRSLERATYPVGGLGGKHYVVIADGGQATVDKVGVPPHGIGGTLKGASVRRRQLERDEGGKENKKHQH